MVWCCQPVAAAICSTVAPSGRLSSSIICACLVPARGVGLSAGAALVALALPLAALPFFAGVAAPSASVAGAGGVDRLDSGIGRRRARVGRRGALWRVVLGLDADGLEAGAGDPERRRVVAARGALVIDQALGLEAAEDLVDGAALDLERLGQRQDRAVVALRGGAEDDGLGIAELGHGMISVVGEHHRPPTTPSPAGRSPVGARRE